MLREFALSATIIASFFAAPVLAQIPELEPDGRGIPTIAPLIEKVDDAVVNISVVSERPSQMTPLFRDPFFRPFLPPLEELPPQRQMSAGSGVIIYAEAGYVLTNSHVVENGDEIRVTLRDRRSFDADIIGRDPATDIAVLQIEADGLEEIKMGNSEDLLVGDFVVAIGNPFGLGQTVTSGIVSALGRSGINPQGYEDFIQTDASINPGNSGGALITLDGNLVGINTAIISPGGGNVGVGFAVPINMARAVTEQLIQYGEVQRGRLGVMIQDLTPELAEALGLDVNSGAIISSVENGTAADQAGLQPGDVIVSVDDARVDSSADLRQRIGIQRPGDKLELAIVRAGERRKVMVQLGRGEGVALRSERSASRDALSGVRLSPLDEGMPGYGEADGVAVLDVVPGSAAARAGLEPGDVITAVNQQPVESIRDIDRALSESRRAIALSIWRNGRQMFLVLRS